jgi:hypothetical protein
MSERDLFWMKVYFTNKILNEEPEIEWVIYFDSDMLFNI